MLCVECQAHRKVTRNMSNCRWQAPGYSNSNTATVVSLRGAGHGTRDTYTQRERLVHIYLTSMIAAETMPTNYINHSKCHVLNRAQDTWDTLDTRQRDKRQATDDMRVDMVNVSAREVETLNGSAWLLGLREAGGAAKRFIVKLSIKLIAVNEEVSLWSKLHWFYVK